MKKILATGNPGNYIDALKALSMLPEGTNVRGLPKYRMTGSKKTYYHKSDLEPLLKIAEQKRQKLPENIVLYAYVDGSFNKNTGVYGSAAVITDGETELCRKTSSGKKMNSMRNIAGEICAAALAVELAEELMPDELVIRHDYEGVGKWPTGEFKAKNEYTQRYAEYMNRKRIFKIRYEHVKAHSGDHFNELVDDLSIEACGLQTMKNSTPPFEGSRNTLTENERLIRLQVCASCLDGIREFYSKDKHAFKDYAALKCHMTDNLSMMKMPSQFNDILTNDEVVYICREAFEKDDILNALRWCARGLTAEDAVQKARVDKEIYKNRG